jgi:hypothetical protein
MKLIKLIFENPLKDVPSSGVTARDIVSLFKDKGGTVVGSGDYGTVVVIADKAYKITTDEVELEHAEILKGKKTRHFAKIHDLKVINPKLGVIVMDNLNKLPNDMEISEDFIEGIQDEAERLGIDPDELDMWVHGDKIKRDNFMIDSKGSIRMVDV